MNTLHGDNTGQTNTFIDTTRWATATNLTDIVQAPIPYATLNQAALYQLLNIGFLPYPLTPFPNVLMLGIGDTLTPTMAGKNPLYTYENPYALEKSRQNEVPSTDTLLSHLTRSIELRVPANRNVILMQSAGKDSTALALALARSSIDKSRITCITFSNNTVNDEDGIAADICKKLGLKHQRVVINQHDTALPTLLEKAFSTAELPALDHATIPYLQCLAQVNANNAVILDGTGIDIYFGVTAPRWLQQADRYMPHGLPCKSLLRPFVPRRFLPARWLTSRPEIHFGMGLLARSELAEIFPSVTKQERHRWDNIGHQTKHHSLLDIRSGTRLKHQDPSQVMRKGRLAAHAFGADIAFPFADAALIDYVFNLPEPARFSADFTTNKILLRQMLKEKLGYDAAQIGKRVFYFDSHALFKRLRPWVEDVVLKNPYWQQSNTTHALSPILQQVYRELDYKNYRSRTALAGLLQLSLWLKHAPFFAPPK